MDSKERTTYLALAAISLGLVLGAVTLSEARDDLLSAYFLDKDLVAGFLKELGFAGIIAVVVIFTVERSSKARQAEFVEELISKSNKSLFYAIFNRRLPDAIFKQVEKTILSSNVCRREYELDYELTELQENPNLLKAKFRSRYVLINTTGSELKHEVVVAIEKPIDVKLSAYCGVLSLRIDGREIRKDEIAEHARVSDVHVEVRYPITLLKDREVEVVMTATTIKLKTDTELWSSRIPSEGVLLTVRLPNSSYAVNANALHESAFTVMQGDDSVRQWELREPILPFQGFVIWWTAKVA
jgi:hypothetical protein